MRASVIFGAAIVAMLIIANLVLPAIDPWLQATVSFVRSQLMRIGVPTDAAMTAGTGLHFIVSIALVWSPAFIAWRSWRRIRSKPWVYNWAEMQRNPWKFNKYNSQRNVSPKPKPAWWRRLLTAVVDEIITRIVALIVLTCIAALIIFYHALINFFQR
jgi:hypothetical protein